MIPILYDYNETTFTTNGLGRLSDCISCIVTEERNGRFDLEFSYPINGIHFEDILEGRIIAVTHDDTGDVQPFVIYRSEKPIDGIVTFSAYHISYRLADFWYSFANGPITNKTASQILAELNTMASGWTFSTDITGTASEFGTDPAPYNLRAWLGGMDGSVLDTFGGEYKFDRFTVRLLKNRGANNGVKISYGKNLTEFKFETDYSSAFTHVVPYFSGDYTYTIGGNTFEADGVVIGSVTDSGHRLPGNRVAERAIDFTDKFTDTDSKDIAAISAKLGTLATAYAAANKVWEPQIGLDVDFVQLWETEEFKKFAPLQKCQLCDSVNVSFGMYGIADMAIKIVAVEWDALANRYTKMTLGGLATTLAESINAAISGSVQANADAIKSLKNRTGGGGVQDVTVNGSSVVTDGVAEITLPTVQGLTLTRTNNSYVNATNFARLTASKYGRSGEINFNLAFSTSMPNGTALTQIGTLTGATLAHEIDVTIPCQSNNATILVQITTSGAINVGNFSGTATGTNFFRSIIPLQFTA